jgi:hypothetical protein
MQPIRITFMVRGVVFRRGGQGAGHGQGAEPIQAGQQQGSRMLTGM